MRSRHVEHSTAVVLLLELLEDQMRKEGASRSSGTLKRERQIYCSVESQSTNDDLREDYRALWAIERPVKGDWCFGTI